VSFTRLKHFLGIDRAIGVTSATQLMRFVTGPITMLLIIKYLTPTDQGFYYAFAGVAGIQVFLEAGFAVSIAQFTAKEFAGLRFTKSGFLTGRSENLSRLRSIYQKAFRYYSAMGVVLTFGIGIGGYVFFSSRPSEGVHWQIPWVVVAVCMGFQFLLTPFWAILEGCNRVADVATYYFWMTLIGFTASALGFVITQSLDVVIFTSVASLLTGYAYIFSKWLKLRSQVIRPFRKHQQVAWFKDIWGFQWRIAIVWGAKYILFFSMAPIAMAVGTPELAGRVGITFQLAFFACSLASSFTNTKIPRWGAMISNNNCQSFYSEWLRFSKLHVLASTTFMVVLLVVFSLATLLVPGISSRFLTLEAFAILAIAMVAHAFWLCFSHFFRSGRIEPYTGLTVIAAVTYLMLIYLWKHWPNALGIASAFFVTNAIAAFFAYFIWTQRKHTIL
jgi:hypothetical protein